MSVVYAAQCVVLCYGSSSRLGHWTVAEVLSMEDAPVATPDPRPPRTEALIPRLLSVGDGDGLSPVLSPPGNLLSTQGSCLTQSCYAMPVTHPHPTKAWPPCRNSGQFCRVTHPSSEASCGICWNHSPHSPSAPPRPSFCRLEKGKAQPKS